MWLVLQRSAIDVCAKDPGYRVDIVFRGRIADFVAVYLGHKAWSDVKDKAISVEGDRALVSKFPSWIRLDKVVGRDFPLVRPA
jgi:hypothetical protein